MYGFFNRRILNLYYFSNRQLSFLVHWILVHKTIVFWNVRF